MVRGRTIALACAVVLVVVIVGVGWLNGRVRENYIDYVVKERESGDKLAAGKKALQASDIQAQKRGGGFLKALLGGGSESYSKSIALSEDFELGITIEPEVDRSKISRFAMWLRRTDVPTFGGDSFNLEKDDIAVKRHGPGRLRVHLELVDGAWQIARTDFLSDVVFRCHKTPPLSKSRAMQPDWIARVRKGSSINWRLAESEGVDK